MSNVGSQVVFLINPDFQKYYSCSTVENSWQDIIYYAAIRILTYFSYNSDQTLRWNLKKNCLLKSVNYVKWGYKFAGEDGIKLHSDCELKPFNLENLELFYEELKAKSNDYSKDFNAHVLVDALIALIHDFEWEQHQIFSPVKSIRKRLTYKCAKKSDCKSFLQDVPLSGNFVFIVGYLPKSKEELHSYFQLQVENADDISNILMPKHLAKHFCDRLNVNLFWLDTDGTNSEELEKLCNKDGLFLMKQFLFSKKGFVIPISLLEKEAFNLGLADCSEMKDNFNNGRLENCNQLLMSSHKSSPCNFSTLNDTIGSDNVFEDVHSSESQTRDVQQSPTISISSILSFFLNNMIFTGNVANGQSRSSKLLLNKKGENAIASIVLTRQKVVGNPPLYYSLFYNIQRMLPSYSTKMLSIENLLKCNEVCSKSSNSFVSLHLQSNYSVNGIFHNSKEIFTSNISKDCFPEPSSFKVLGAAPSCMNLTATLDSTIICFPQNESAEFKSIMTYLLQNGIVLVVERGCKFCGTAQLKDCSILHSYGLLQPLNGLCATISWLSELQKEKIVWLLGLCYNSENEVSEEATHLVEDTTSACDSSSILSHQRKDSCVPTSQQYTDEFETFHPSLLEKWCKNSTDSKESDRCVDNSNESLFNDSIISELQSLYKSQTYLLRTRKTASALPEFTRHQRVPDFPSWKKVEEFINIEYVNGLKYSAQVEHLKEVANLLVTTVHCHAKKQDSSDALDIVQDYLNQKLFLSASTIGDKNKDPERSSTECKLQILLHMEWFCCFISSTNKIDDFDVESIVQLLRAISLLQSVEEMRVFLRDSLTDFYAKSCGQLLSDVHNDLMIPLPEELQDYCCDSVFDSNMYGSVSVKSEEPPSTGPFSLASSVGSQESADSSIRSGHLRVSSHLKPVLTRQIVVPNDSKSGERSRSGSMEPNILQNVSTKNNDIKLKDAESRSQSSTGGGISSVCRDLFASPSKPRKNSFKKTDKISVAKNPGKKTGRKRTPSVIDTPAAKQRLTALARQRLRLRRSEEALRGESEKKETVVEESPLKDNEERKDLATTVVEQNIRKSPRHSIMLARRHSFYRENAGGKSRTATRAQVIQDHNEAAPPTPYINPLFSVSSGRRTQLFSPKSLLFSYTRSNQTKPIGGGEDKAKSQPVVGRTRRKLQLDSSLAPLVGDSKLLSSCSAASSVKLVQNDVTNSSVSTPSLPPCTFLNNKLPVYSPILKKASGDLPPFVYEPHDSSATSELTEVPFRSYKNATRSEDDPTDLNSFDERFTGSASSVPSQGRLNAEVADQVLRPPPLTPVLQLRRSPRLIGRLSEMSTPPPLRKVGPLDDYVIRTPSSSKQTKQQPAVPLPTAKRKPSPNGDHIKKWPRKKRFSDNLSPDRAIKRRKKVSSTGCLTSHETTLSPNHGAYIVSGSGDNQRIRKACSLPDEVSPGVEVADLLKESGGHRTFSSTMKAGFLPTDILDEMGVRPIVDATPPCFMKSTSQHTSGISCAVDLLLDLNTPLHDSP